MKNFEGFGLSPALNHSLAKMSYTAPTPIQAKAIPLAMQGRDILGSAQTGTGKTAAFSIPMVEALLRSPQGNALILTPTRELAKQVLDVVHQLLGFKSPIKTAFIIGGEPIGKQFNQLRQNPRIIVGTPGRVNDHLERGTIMLNETNFLVLDETDRMLDMGFGVQLDKIVKFLPARRQTLMFSATMPDEITKLSSKYLNNPERISMGATNVVATNITQEVIRINQEDKYKELQTQLHERNGSIIIFAKTKRSCDKLARNLGRDGFEADALHGDLRQSKRTSVLNRYRMKKFRILVATDVAARGLDVPHIEHVINYDLPQVAEDYIHRMGRTARAGATGQALSFVSPQDGRKWHAIECLLDPSKAAASGGHGGGDRNRKGGRGGYKGKGGGAGNRYDRSSSGPKKYGNKPRRSGAGKPGEKTYAKPGERTFSKPGERSGEKRSANQSPSGKPYAGKTAHGKPSGKPSGKPYAGKSSGKPYAGKSGGKPYQGKSSDRPARSGEGGGQPAKRKGANNGGRPGGHFKGKPAKSHHRGQGPKGNGHSPRRAA